MKVGCYAGENQYDDFREEVIAQSGYPFNGAFECRKCGLRDQSGFQKVVDGGPQPVIDRDLRDNQQRQGDQQPYVDRKILQKWNRNAVPESQPLHCREEEQRQPRQRYGKDCSPRDAGPFLPGRIHSTL